MSEVSDNHSTEHETPAPISNQRILWLMAFVVVLSSLVGFIFYSLLAGLGVFIGGILSLVNYYWLRKSLKVVFDGIVEGEKPRFLAGKYFLRYITLGVILTLVFLTHTVPIVSVLLGLASFSLAIVLEGFIRLFFSFFNRKE